MIGQQREPIAIREEPEQLDDDGGDAAGLREQLFDDGALAGGRDGGVRQHALEEIVPRDELRKRREIASHLLDVRFLQRDVEQRARVAGAGGPARHCAASLVPCVPRATCDVNRSTRRS